MAEFLYKALEIGGKRINGTVEASSSDEAVSILKDKNLYVIDIREKVEYKASKNIELFSGVKTRDLALLCRQITTMLNAGVNMLNILGILADQTSNRRLSRAIGDMFRKVEKGNPVSTSMREHADIFPDILINMVEAGEVGGSLERSFDKMATFFEKEDKLKKKITNALIYPIMVMITAIIVINILMIFVLPTFIGIFNEMNIDLPAATKFLIAASNFLRTKWYVVLIIIIAAVMGWNIFKKSDAGRYRIDETKLKIPVFGRVIMYTALARFARTLATMLNSGVTLISALETSMKLFTNSYIESKLKDVINRVKGGESLSVPIENTGLFPRLVSVMIKTGEESGNLEMMLDKIGEFYEDEVDNSVTRLTALFEPLMMVFLALIIGFLLASIVLPMFKLYGNV